jgi:transcriptional regulator with XRE-family HTH domain
MSKDSEFIEKLTRGMRIARTIRGLTTKSAAEKAGISETAWNRLENSHTQGLNPRLDTITKVASVLGITIDQLINLSVRAEELLNE